MAVNPQDVTLSLPKQKILKNQEQCKEILSQPSTSFRTLIDRLASTPVAIVPAPLQRRVLQHNQIQEMLSKNYLQEKVTLSDQAKRELNWWIQNLNNFSSPENYKLECLEQRLERIKSRTTF